MIKILTDILILIDSDSMMEKVWKIIIQYLFKDPTDATIISITALSCINICILCYCFKSLIIIYHRDVSIPLNVLCGEIHTIITLFDIETPHCLLLLIKPKFRHLTSDTQHQIADIITCNIVLYYRKYSLDNKTSSHTDFDWSWCSSNSFMNSKLILNTLHYYNHE